MNILEFDCRGLEFTEFKAEVRLSAVRTAAFWLADWIHRGSS